MSGKVKKISILAFCLLASFLVIVVGWSIYEKRSAPPVPAATSVGAAGQDSGLVAVVGAQRITRADLDRTIKSRVFELERQIYGLRKQKLDQAVLQIVLQKEAEKQGMAIQQLVNGILSSGVEVTRDEIDAYFSANHNLFKDWKGTQEELEQNIADQIGKQKGYQKVTEYARSLAETYGVKIYLEEPQAPTVSVDAGKDPVIGPDSARMTIVEFSDYQCSACRKTHEIVKQVRGLYQNEVRWVFKDFPLAPSSVIAAEAARCANEQGKFAEYQDLLFSTSSELTPEQFIAYAGQLGLKVDAFRECFESRRYRRDVEKNIEEGTRAGVNMTPTYIINGKMFPGGPPLDEFKRLVSKELKAEVKGQEGGNKSTM